MDEEKKNKVVEMFKTNSRPKTTRRKAATVKPGNVIYVNGDGVAAGQIAGGDIHNHVNEKKVVRPKVIRGPGCISPAAARKIQNRINTLVKTDMAAGEAGGDSNKLYAKWHAMLKNHFAVPSYLEIPAHQEQYALDWLQQQKVLRRPKIRRAANDMWRGQHYAGIWARSKELGMSKADVYNLVMDKLEKKVASLKSLGERDLKKLYTIIFNIPRQK